jgi:hypothetical protein
MTANKTETIEIQIETRGRRKKEKRRGGIVQ